MLTDAGRAYLSVLIFSSILAWSSFFGIIFFVNPQSAGELGVIVLYISGALGLISLPIILWRIIKLLKK